jgi:hypothetical protein
MNNMPETAAERGGRGRQREVRFSLSRWLMLLMRLARDGCQVFGALWHGYIVIIIMSLMSGVRVPVFRIPVEGQVWRQGEMISAGVCRMSM